MQTLIKCDSSLISGYLYDENSWELTVEFRGTGKRKVYGSIGPDVYADFEASGSKGRFLNDNVFRKFPVQDLDAPATVEAVAPKEDEMDFSNQMDEDIAALEASWAKDQPETVTVAGRETLTYAGTVQSMPRQQPAIDSLFPDEPAELPKKNEAAIAAMTEEARLIASKSYVVTAATYQSVYDHVADMTARRKRLFEFLDPIREAMYRAYSLMQSRQKSALEPLDNAIKAGKQALLTYDLEQQRIAWEAQRKADEAAAAAAEAERKRQSEEFTLAEVNDALASGDTERAEELIANPIELAPMPTFAPRVEAAIPQMAGKSTRKNWKAVVTDREALILDIAKGIEHFKVHGHTGPHAPDTFISFNDTAMNQMAKAKESKMIYPGVHAENNPVMSIRS